MQIVIDVPKAWEKCNIRFIKECIRKGTPLPEHHGRLIDADNLIKDRVENDNVVILAKIAPAIVEATGVKE